MSSSSERVANESGGEDPIALLRTMTLVREFELVVGASFAKGEIPGFTHLSLGEEASTVGVCSALRPSDWITSTHRGHGHCLAKGSDPRRVMAEIYGRVDGLCGGRGGSMHLYDFGNGVLGTNGIIGSGGGIACGAALAGRRAGTDQVAVVFMGDGAADQGATHEAMNLASVWSLPVIFVIENNGFSEGTPVRSHAAIDRLVDRAAAYSMPGVQVDGQDVRAVRAAAVEAVRRARSGMGPTLIETITTRYKGHFEGDAMRYILEPSWAAKDRDPIEVLVADLESAGRVTSQDLAALRESVLAVVNEALEFARNSPFPGPERLTDFLFATEGEIA